MRKDYRVNHYTTPTGEVYRFSAKDIPMTRYGQVRRATLSRSTDGGASWTEMSFDLCLRSRLTVLASDTRWPPVTIDEVAVTDGHLHVVYHDRENEYERPLLPFGLDTESVWRADYIAERRCWRLKRLRHLDFDGADRHLRVDDAQLHDE